MEKQDREIARILAGKGISWNEMTESKKELARRVYDVAIPKIDKIQKLENELDRCRFNKQTIASELGINRKTLGCNNPEVAVLIDTLAKKGHARHSLSKKLDEYKNEIKELKSRINDFVARDCDLVQMDQKCRDLEKELALINHHYETMKKEKESLEKNLSEQSKNTKEALGLISKNKKEIVS